MTVSSRDVRGQIHTERRGPDQHGREPLVEQVVGRRLAALQGRQHATDRGRRLADAGGSEQQRVGARHDPSAQQQVELGRTGRRAPGIEAGVVLGRDQARERLDAAGLQHEVVVTAAELDAAHLDDAEPPPLGAVLASEAG